jgi:hypothetical protein
MQSATGHDAVFDHLHREEGPRIPIEAIRDALVFFLLQGVFAYLGTALADWKGRRPSAIVLRWSKSSPLSWQPPPTR